MRMCVCVGGGGGSVCVRMCLWVGGGAVCGCVRCLCVLGDLDTRGNESVDGGKRQGEGKGRMTEIGG